MHQGFKMAVFMLRSSDNTELGLLQQIDEQAFLYDSNGGFGTSVSIYPMENILL